MQAEVPRNSWNAYVKVRDHSEAVYADIGCLRPLSRVAYATLQAIHEKEFSIDGLLLLLEGEPQFAAQLLDGINAQPNRMPAPARSLSAAVAFIGGAQLVRWVSASCLAPYFGGVDHGYQLPEGATFEHALACGLVAEFLADRTGAAHPMAAFTGGLLHDLGKIALTRYLAKEPDAFRQAMQAGGDLLAAERDLVGVDHPTTGGMIADRWLLPAALRRCIRDHHDPQRFATDATLTPLVHIADAACAEIGLGRGADKGQPRPATDLFDRLGLGRNLARDAKPMLADELGRLAAMLTLTTAVSV